MEDPDDHIRRVQKPKSKQSRQLILKLKKWEKVKVVGQAQPEILQVVAETINKHQ